MEVRFSREEELRIAKLAGDSGRDSESLIRDTVLGVMEERARFAAMVREGIAQADRGQFIEEDEMDARFEALLR